MWYYDNTFLRLYGSNIIRYSDYILIRWYAIKMIWFCDNMFLRLYCSKMIRYWDDILLRRYGIKMKCY